MKESTRNCELGEVKRLAEREKELRDYFLTHAKVSNYERGYINAPWVNQLVDPYYQGIAADIITDHFRGYGINKIVGIPTVGVPLASIVHDRMGLPLAMGRKGLQKPGAWDNAIIIKEEVPSFTTGKMSEFVYNGLNAGDKVLIVDDVIAYGYTLQVMINHFREHGIEAHVAVYFAKKFQPGVDEIRKNTGVEPFYVVGIEEISEERIERLSPPRY